MQSNGLVILTAPEGSLYKPQPNDLKINTTGGIGNFGKQEIERAAGLLLSFFQSIGTWREFTLEEYRRFLEQKCNADLEISLETGLLGLVGAWFDDAKIVGGIKEPRWTYIVQLPKQGFAVTDHFVAKIAGKL